MGNQYTKNENVNLSSSDIHDNIRKAFNANTKNDYTIDSIGWNNQQKGGKNYVNGKRYEPFKDLSNKKNGHIPNNNINAINGNSDLFTDSIKNNTFVQKNSHYGGSEPVRNRFKDGSYDDGEYTEINQLKQLIESKFGGNSNSEASIFDNMSSPNSDIEKLKNIISKQMGGGCGCSGDYFVSPNMHDINLSVLKGGSKKSENSSKSERDATYDDTDGNNESDNESDNDAQYGNNDIDEYNDDENEEINDDTNDNVIESFDETDDVESMSHVSRSASRNQVINVTPFYSTETISASAYFNNLNKNK